MIFNPLFIDSDSGQLNLLGSAKSSGNSHLFQDIIKCQDEMLNQREFNSTTLLPSLLSDVKKMKTSGEYNNQMSSANLLNSNSAELAEYLQNAGLEDNSGLENLSEEDIHSLLESVFSDLELSSGENTSSNEILSSVDTDDLVGEIQQKLTEQGDVKCLISNVDDNTNLLLTIKKAGEGADSEDGVLLDTSKEGGETGEKYVLNILELDADSDVDTDADINSGLLGASSLLMQLINQTKNFTDSAANGESTADSISAIGDVLSTGAKSSAVMGDAIAAGVENSDADNSAVDFMVKVSAKEMTKADKELLAKMDLSSLAKANSDINTVSQNSGANVFSISDEIAGTDESTDNLLNHFADSASQGNKKAGESTNSAKEGDAKIVNADKAAGSANTVKDASGNTANNNSTSDGSGNDSKNDNKHADSGVKSQTTFKIDDPTASNVLQNSNNQAQQYTADRVVKVVAQDVQNPQLANELSDEITDMVISKGNDKAVILLEPKELGKMKVSIEVNENQVHAKVEVDSTIVKDMLQNNSESLKQNLTNSGLQLGSLSIALQQNADKGNDNASGKQTKKSERIAGIQDIDSVEGEEVSNKAMGYNTYEYII